MHAWINITHPGFSGRQEMPDDGDQWVSWEQMVATLRAKGEAEGRAALLAREVIELRGEVAKFKPLEMILAKGGDPVQHLSEAVLDLSAKVRSMEESSRLDQSEILRLTRCVAEVIHARLMVAKIDVQGMQSLADSITDQEMRDPDNAEKVWCEKINAWFCEHSSAIPADRVLGDGMVAVPREEWERLQKFERDTKEADSRDCSDCAHYRRSQSCPGCTHPESPQNEYAFDWLLAQRCEFYALRANQGGADVSDKKNPTKIVTTDGSTLYFHEVHGNQRCSDCWCTYFGGCSDAPCSSQDRTDGKVGHWSDVAPC